MTTSQCSARCICKKPAGDAGAITGPAQAAIGRVVQDPTDFSALDAPSGIDGATGKTAAPREFGVVASAAGLVPFGHLGWGYRHRTEFLDRVAEYIADGLDHGQRVEYVGAGSHETLRAELAAVPGIAERANAGDITVSTVQKFYAMSPGAEMIDPHAAVAARVAAVENAIADGYTGLRAVTDNTALVQTPRQRDAFACFEHLIGQQMGVLPISGLCAYDLNQLGAAADELICLHPYANRHAPGFRLCAHPENHFALSGDVDAATDALFATTLHRITPRATDTTLVVDAQDLNFIGRQSLVTLNRYADNTGRKVILRTAQRIPTRLASLLALPNVAVEHPATQRPEVQSLLGGLEGSARAEHAELVGWLLGQGVTADQIRNTPMPMLVASRRIIGVDDQYISAREISEYSGVDIALIQRVLHAVGLGRVDDPDAAVYLRADGAIVAHFQKFVDAGLDPEHLIQVIHVVTEGLSPAAEVMRYMGLAAALRPGATELEIAQRSQALVNRVAPLLGPWIADMLFLQLRNRTDTEALTVDERAAGSALPGARDVTVAFVDLVGFTRLGEMGSAEQLEQLAKRLTARARDVAVPPVRFIKTIGDAVMFICTATGPDRLLDAVLRLFETTNTGTDALQLRAGVASGPAISRAGDWFGSPVNLASRVTATAPPGTVAITESVQHDLGEASGLSWSFAGTHDLKGIPGDVKLFHTQRAETRIAHGRRAQPQTGPESASAPAND